VTYGQSQVEVLHHAEVFFLRAGNRCRPAESTAGPLPWTEIAEADGTRSTLENWLPINRKDENMDVILRIYMPDMEKFKTRQAPKAEMVK